MKCRLVGLRHPIPLCLRDKCLSQLLGCCSGKRRIHFYVVIQFTVNAGLSRVWRHLPLSGREWYLYWSLGLSHSFAGAGFHLRSWLSANKFGQIWPILYTKAGPAQLRALCLGWRRCHLLLGAASSGTRVVSRGISRAIKQERRWLVHRLR